jgi:CubicO group peptidase (beta-lactamase class C family)
MLAPIVPAPAMAQAAPAPATIAPVKAADVLDWTQAQRQDRFPRMQTLLPHRTVKAGGKVHSLPRGRPLAIATDKDGNPWSLDAFMKADNTAGLLVLQDGKIRLERYGPTLNRTGHWASFSVTKSVTSTLYGAALKDGYIKSLDDSVVTYLPEMKGSAYEAVTIRDLLTMRSGVKWSEDYTNPQSEVARMYATPADPGFDPIVSFMRHLPREAPAGTKWNYKTGETDLAGILLVRATGKSLSDYLSQKIWKPYGMQQDAVWMINEQGNEPGGCCLSASLRDLGRFGQFILDGGMIDGKPVLAADWLPQATSTQAQIGRPGMAMTYGYFWWINNDGSYDARGIFGQGIHIDPKRRLVVVVLAAWPAVFDMDHAKGRTTFMDAVTAAVDAQPEKKR